ncbi:MAG: putative lipid II flippase FtsW [Clostridia bacterium]|nr:putative lipid II flippase FtsW [Clostridia bacterium]
MNSSMQQRSQAAGRTNGTSTNGTSTKGTVGTPDYDPRAAIRGAAGASGKASVSADPALRRRPIPRQTRNPGSAQTQRPQRNGSQAPGTPNIHGSGQNPRQMQNPNSHPQQRTSAPGGQSSQKNGAASVRGGAAPVRGGTAAASAPTAGTAPGVARTPKDDSEARRVRAEQLRKNEQRRAAKEKEDEPVETLIRLRGNVDRPFLVLVIILVCLGSAMVFSSSYAYAEYHFDDSLYFIRSQLQWAALGFVAMIVVMQFDYRWFQKLTMPAFFGTSFLLALVPFIGKTVKGAKRWIVLGPIQIQPSEMMKLALVMVLALYVSASRGQMKTFRRGIFYPYLLIGAVCFVTALEKHLSATMILLMIGTMVIFIGGAPVKPIAIAVGSGAGVVGLLILIFDYARKRVQFWLQPETDPASSGYQLLQSLYAIGSGGFLGVGLGNSRQKYLYLPEAQNDFIYAVICEEFGMVGAVAVIILFALLLWRGYVIASHAPDTYSSLLVMGIITQVALQCIMNIAVVTGSMPVTGVSLPFFSYGGSSLVMLMFEMGMILAVSRYSYQQS